MRTTGGHIRTTGGHMRTTGGHMRTTGGHMRTTGSPRPVGLGKPYGLVIHREPAQN